VRDAGPDPYVTLIFVALLVFVVWILWANDRLARWHEERSKRGRHELGAVGAFVVRGLEALARPLRRVWQMGTALCLISWVPFIAYFYFLHDDPAREAPSLTRTALSLDNHGASRFLDPTELWLYCSAKWWTFSLVFGVFGAGGLAGLIDGVRELLYPGLGRPAPAGERTKAPKGVRSIDSRWLLLPSMLMSFLSVACWWSAPLVWAVPIWLTIMTLPYASLWVSVAVARATRRFSDRTPSLWLANLSSLVALTGLAFLLETKLSWNVWHNPSSPEDTAKAIGLVLAVGCAAFVAPGIVPASRRARARRYTGGADVRAS